ncbi:MAG: hypothetical protein BWZ10_03348 [candidate division BRC1 bacterium ADurb.BinA364]|nr:MAG: hypothetical protein BWZ10_03348 [candidate division BRC1 bacterium ADurb.BinA364]
MHNASGFTGSASAKTRAATRIESKDKESREPAERQSHTAPGSPGAEIATAATADSPPKRRPSALASALQLAWIFCGTAEETWGRAHPGKPPPRTRIARRSAMDSRASERSKYVQSKRPSMASTSAHSARSTAPSSAELAMSSGRSAVVGSGQSKTCAGGICAAAAARKRIRKNGKLAGDNARIGRASSSIFSSRREPAFRHFGRSINSARRNACRRRAESAVSRTKIRHPRHKDRRRLGSGSD